MTVTAGVAVPEADVDDQKTATVVLWQDGRRLQIRGAMGTGTIRPIASANRLQIECTWMGIMDAPTDAAMPSDPTFALTCFSARNASVSLGGSAAQPTDGFSLDLGVDVQSRDDITQSSGIAHFIASNVQPTLELPTEAARVATEDAHGKLLVDTAEALVLTCPDGEGNTLTIASPAAQRTGVADGDRNGKRLDTLTLGLYSTDAAEGLTITRGT